MLEWFKYIFEMLICGGIFVLLYKGLVERHASYRWCRIYLLLSTAVSFLIPLLEIPIWPAKVPVVYLQPQPEIVTEATGVSTQAAAVEAVTAAHDFSWIPTAIYAIVLVVSLSLYIIGLAKILRIRRSAILSRTEAYTLAESPKVHSPFSFLRTIYIGEDLDETERRVVLEHEESHIRHRHSLERLLMSLMTAAAWFNPFVQMSARYLEEVQEWEADSEVLSGGCNIDLYRNIIFKQLFGYYPEISCGLRNSLTKKRFKMMTKPFKDSALHIAVALVLAAGTAFVFGATAKPSKVVMTEADALTRNAEQTDTLDSQDVALIEVTKGGSEIRVDGKMVTEHKFEIAPNKHVIIKVESDVQAGVITDIKSKLREQGVTSIKVEVDELMTESTWEEAVPFAWVEEKPKFGDGTEADFQKWVYSQIKYPAEAVEKNIQGRVTLQYTVGKDGNVKDVKVLRGVDPILDNEAVRVVSSSPVWTPAKYKGKLVDVMFILPITFQFKKPENTDS